MPSDFLIAALLFFAVQVPQIPAGTVIPIMLSSSLNAEKGKNDQRLTGRVMQDVPLPNGGKVNEGATVRGHVVKVEKPGSSGARLVVRFESIEDRGETIPITAALLALASMS